MYVVRTCDLGQRLPRVPTGECPSDPPPLKWSALSYGFRAEEDHDAEEETQARGDCCEAAPSGRAGVPRSERCRRGSFDWRDGGDLLPLAPGVWRAQE